MFIIDILKAISTLYIIQTATEEQISRGGETVAAEMQAYAKAFAPWHDRTGNARRTLEGRFEADNGTMFIGMYGHMPYSPRLELGFQGRYTILAPTVAHYAPKVIEMIRDSVVSAASHAGGSTK